MYLSEEENKALIFALKKSLRRLTIFLMLTLSQRYGGLNIRIQ